MIDRDLESPMSLKRARPKSHRELGNENGVGWTEPRPPKLSLARGSKAIHDHPNESHASRLLALHLVWARN